MTELESGWGGWGGDSGSFRTTVDQPARDRPPAAPTAAEPAGRSGAAALHQIAQAAGEALVRTIELHDPWTGRHHRQVSHVAALIARGLGLPEAEVEGIGLAASLHDIGKVGLPRSILSNTGRLSFAELQQLQTHAEAGYQLLQGIEFPWPVADMVRQHHERLDGSGYPAGLAGDGILPGARIITVADVLAAMTAERTYRATPGLEAALDELRQGRGVLYDAAAVDVCMALCEREPALVFLEGGSTARADGGSGASAPAPPPQARLTAQQQLVMHLVAEGRSTKDIARALGLGLGTVKVHLSRAYRALGVRNRAGAVRVVISEDRR